MSNNTFVKKSINEKDIFFETKQQPNSYLIQALKEVEAMEKKTYPKKSYHNIDEMFNDILNEKNWRNKKEIVRFCLRFNLIV